MYHILHTNKTKQEDIKLLFLARFRYIVAVMFLICRMETVAGRIQDWLRDFLNQYVYAYWTLKPCQNEETACP